MALNPMDSITLTPLDLIMPRFYTRMILTFETTPARNNDAAIKALERGFDALVKEYPFLSGLLKPTSKGIGHLEIDLSEKRFLKVKVVDLSETQQNGLDAQAAIGVMAAEDGSLPGCAAQINILPSTISVSFCVHHAVSDANGISALLRRWAELSAGVSVSAQSTIDADRTFVLHAGRADPSITHPAYNIPSLPSPADPDYKPDFTNHPIMRAEIFEFDVDKLAQLKADVQEALKPSNAWTSTNDVLTALIWHGVTRARLGDRSPILERHVRLGMAVNGRSKLDPPLSPSYVGNVNIYAAAAISMSVLAELSVSKIAETALAIRRVVTAVDDKYIRALIAVVDEQEDITGVKPSFNSFLGPDLAISSWAELGIGGLDWGQEFGKADRVRIPTTGGFDGLCIVMPKMEGKGVEVLIGLKEDDMRELQGDQEFAKYPTQSRVNYESRGSEDMMMRTNLIEYRWTHAGSVKTAKVVDTLEVQC